MQFQQDCPKDKKITALSIFWRKTWKISLDGALWCASRGIDNFSLLQLYMPYVNGKLSISWVEVCIFQQDRRKTKKLPRSKLFLWTVLKHGLLDNFTSIQRHNSYTIEKLSIKRVKICNFTRIGRKTEELERSKVQKMTLRDERTWSLYCT